MHRNRQAEQSTRRKTGLVPAILGATVLLLFAACFAVGMEWLFFVTKPSFMSAWPPLFKIEAPALLILQLVLLGGVAIVIAAPVAGPLMRWGNPYSWAGRALLLVPAAALLTLSAALLIDNFSQTLFSLGIADVRGPVRWSYVFGLAALGFALLGMLVAFLEGPAWRHHRTAVLGLASIALLGVLLPSAWALHRQATTSEALGMSPVREAGPLRLPNIVLIATDGVSNKIHSFGGNPNATTPTIDALVPGALQARQAYTNSERTTGALTSLLTGKAPTSTRVLFPPHTLVGDDALQHLPGLLQKLGYVNFQESVRYYGDANDLNFVDAFDLVNGVEDRDQRNSRLAAVFDAVLHARLFARRLDARVEERFRHLVLEQPMPDPYREVKGQDDPRVYAFKDRQRIERARLFLAEVEGPFLLHVHLMGTHCCNFKPRDPVFSRAAFATEMDEERARLQDLLREADALIAELLEALEANGKLENTLIVYLSDHPEYWEFEVAIPLLFRFPGDEHAGVIESNAQLLDVAPTILDYMNVEAPPWMEGDSLLAGAPDPYRPIFGVTQLERERFVGETRDHLSRIVGSGPPTYGLRIMAMIVCNRWYHYVLETDAVISGPVPGHVGACDPARLPDDGEARRMLRDHLVKRGFIAPDGQTDPNVAQASRTHQ